MSAQGGQRQNRILPALVVGGLSIAAWREIGGPLVSAGGINILPALAVLGMGLSGLALVTDTLTLIADLCGYAKARIPTGRKGKAAFATSLKEIRRDLVKHGWGPLFGTFKGMPVFPDIEASAYVIGPSGSGKTTRFTIPSIMALKGHPKVFYCYKSDITPQVAKVLRKRGERLRIINLGGLYEKEIGQETDTYNPLVLVSETFFLKGGLEEITDLVEELSCNLDPDDTGPSDVSNGNFWKENNRRLIGFVILMVVLVEGENGTLGQCLQMLNDKQNLLKHAQWAAGRLEAEQDGVVSVAAMPIDQSPWAHLHDPEDVANFANFLCALASGIADIMEQPDGKLADSMLSGARVSALGKFDITTRANKLTSTCSFRFSELKDKGAVTTVSVMLDPNKMAAHSKILGVLNYCMRVELRRHENKAKKVFLLADEAGVLPWQDMESDLTTLRAYGVIPIFAFQNFPAFAKRHGKSALETLLSEAQVKLFMPGQRNPETLAMIERMLAQQSVIARSNNSIASSGMFTMDGYGLQEDAKPLLSAEEIRRLEQGILMIGNNKPMLVDLPSIAEIAPWRKQLDPSPFYGKPYLKRTRLRIKPYPRSLLSWLGWLVKAVFTLGRSS
ncbi:MAG: type IV secretory system conjugative DNA transfer family protein [Alphaproteobacteria bacterium]|nr:type IV secretory system conjugative DNA transfer family protein [Alphaproteobacteria bacterium]